MYELKSQIDWEQIITSTHWLVSLVRKPTGVNPEHAFILVEGLSPDETQIIYRRYDFFRRNIDPNQRETREPTGLVHIRDFSPSWQSCASENTRERYFWTRLLNDVDQHQGCDGASWTVTSSQATQLHQAVLRSQANPPDYRLSGVHSVFSSSDSGHNCYTWARQMLLGMSNQTICHDGRLKVVLKDYVAARTTRHIAMPENLKEESVSGCKIL